MNLSSLPPLTKLPFHGVVLPSITISPEVHARFGATPGCSNLEFITQLCRLGYVEKVLKHVPEDRQSVYADRVKFELKTINSVGFIDYLAMVWDICDFADRMDIPRGPGRGSIGSSLVAYLIGITEIDPVANGLFFARFLSEARVQSQTIDGVRYVDGSIVPDIDMDYCHHRRSEIFHYLRNRYPGQTSFTLTTGTLTSKALLIDLVKVYEGGSLDEARIASNLINVDAGIPEEVEHAIYGDTDWRESKGTKGKEPNEQFKVWAKDHEDVAELAMEMTGLNRSEGKHASAFLICASKIDELMPLQSAVDEETGERYAVSGYDMYSAQEIVLKFDVLGLKALTVIKNTCDRLGIKPSDIDVNHESIYRELQDFKNRYGIFQLESFAQGNAAERVKPRTFAQLAAVLAISRPGASAFLPQFIKYINEGEFIPVHPLIDDILKPTGGICVFQEQLLAMLVRVGMTPEEADVIRKMVGKKQREKIDEARFQIEAVCREKGRPIEIADLLTKIATDSAKYQFSSAHASCYAIITCRTLYLKVNHPVEFWCETLQMNRNDANKYDGLAEIEREMRATGFTLLPPRLHSSMEFEIVDAKSIRFALGMVRGISDKSLAKLATFIGKGGVSEGVDKFSAFQALKNAGLHIGIGSSLIQAGCMDGYEGYVNPDGTTYRSRSRLVLELLTWNLLTDTDKKLCMTVGALPSVNWDVISALKHLGTLTNEKGKPLIKEVHLNKIRRDYAPYAEIYDMNSRNERLANFWYERRVLGYSYSETIGDIFSEHIDGLVTVKDALAMKPNSRVKLIGFVAEEKKAKTKKGNDEFRFDLSDETGVLRVKAFNDRIKQIESQNGRLPVEGDLLVVNAKVMEGGTVFVEAGLDGVCVGIQTSKIYMKLSEIRDKHTKEDTAPTPPVEFSEIRA